MKIIKSLYKAVKKKYLHFYHFILFNYYHVEFTKNLKINGILKLSINKKGTLRLGTNIVFNNNFQGNVIGRQQPCIISVGEGAELRIGNNVGISSTAIICAEKIIIEDNVKIGGNTCIYDTDFHSLEVSERSRQIEDQDKIIKKSVCVCRNAFIGAHTTILKGVTIGENSIIGACSVVTKDVPANEIWAGNPAKFIRKIPS